MHRRLEVQLRHVHGCVNVHLGRYSGLRGLRQSAGEQQTASTVYQLCLRARVLDCMHFHMFLGI